MAESIRTRYQALKKLYLPKNPNVITVKKKQKHLISLQKCISVFDFISVARNLAHIMYKEI